MTGEEIDIPIKDSPLNNLTIDTALEWLQSNTTLVFGITNADEIKALPSGARLFILKFVEMMSMGAGVSSESIAGMSQSFDTTSKKALITQYAGELLSGYMKSNLNVKYAASQWS